MDLAWISKEQEEVLRRTRSNAKAGEATSGRYIVTNWTLQAFDGVDLRFERPVALFEGGRLSRLPHQAASM